MTSEPAPADLSAYSTAEILAELDERRARADQLLARREQLARELAAVDARLAALARTDGPPAEIADTIARLVPTDHVVSVTVARELLRAHRGPDAVAAPGVIQSALQEDARFKRVGAGQFERVA